MDVITDYLRKQVEYYKLDKDTPLEKVRNSRGVSAVIALALVDLPLFWRLWDYSDYWRCNLVTAARYFGMKINIPDEKSMASQAYIQLRKDIYNGLISNGNRKKIWQNPARINFKLDFMTIEQMLKQAVNERGLS